MKTWSDEKILDSWKKNAAPWSKAIQEKEIASREKVTNKAIIDSVLSVSPKNVLDIGCGEGWLVRALSLEGVSVKGIDAVDGLIEVAKAKSDDDFRVVEYENLSANIFEEKFDLAVCNFSLIGKESVEHVFKVIPSLLNKGGHFIVQTLHPHVSCGDLPYSDSWREGSWDGFSKNFVDAAPWYFRTLESWIDLYNDNGFKLVKVKEPINSETGIVASLLLIGCVST